MAANCLECPGNGNGEEEQEGWLRFPSLVSAQSVSCSSSNRKLMQDKAFEESSAGWLHYREGVRDTLLLPWCLLQFGDKKIRLFSIGEGYQDFGCINFFLVEAMGEIVQCPKAYL